MADDEKAAQNTEKDAEKTSQNDEKVNDTGKDAKKRAKAKPKAKAKVEEVEEVSSEEEEQFGLFDKPVVLEGKRQRKKTDFLVKDQQEIKKPLPIIFNGKGEALGSMEVVSHELSRCSALELKPLHKLLFGRDGRSVEIKRNIRLFNGFNIEKDTKEYENKKFGLERFTNEGLKRLLEILDLEKKGTREHYKERVFEFLLKPKETGRSLKAIQKKGDKKRKSRSKAGKGGKRKRTASKTKKSTKAKDEDDKESDKEESDKEESDKEESDKEESEEEEEEEEEEPEPEEPKKKKAKVGTPSKAKPSPSKAKQKTTSKSKKETPKEEEKDTKKESKGKKTAKKNKPVTVKITVGKRSPKKTPEKVKVPVDEVESSDDEPLAKKIKKQEPTNDELAKTVKDLLKDANFDEVSVKSISKQVFAKYPEFDLSEKKGFIKETVYSVISVDAD